MIIYNYKARKLLTLSFIALLLILGIYKIRNYIDFPKVIQLLTNGSLAQLNYSSEYNQGKAYGNTQFNNIIFYEGNNTKKQIALTFDDGPDTVVTPKILDILKKNDVKATFFILGNRAQRNPEIVKQILKDGHALGNHSWDHKDLDRLSPDKIKSEIQKTDNILFSITGYHPAIVRPPYGAANRKAVQEIGPMGYKVIDWSVDTLDWMGIPPNIIMYTIKREIRPGGIILQHCAGGKKGNLSNTVTALPQIIEYLKSENYEFVRVPELVGTSPGL